MKAACVYVVTQEQLPAVRAAVCDVQEDCLILVCDTLEECKQALHPGEMPAQALGIKEFYIKAFYWPLAAWQQYVALEAARALLVQDYTFVALAWSNIQLPFDEIPAGAQLVLWQAQQAQPPAVNAGFQDLFSGVYTAVGLTKGAQADCYISWCLERFEYLRRNGINPVADTQHTGTTPSDDAAFYALWPQYHSLFGLQANLVSLNTAPAKKNGDYVFDRFANGVEIPPLLRAYLQTNYRLRLRCEANPFTAFAAFAEESVVPGDTAQDPPLTAIAECIWCARPDLQALFPKPRQQDRRGYLEWFAGNATREYKLAAQLVAPVKQALETTQKPKRKWGQGKAQPPTFEEGVNLCGHIRGDYGIGEATRALAQSLNKANIPLTAVDFAREGERLYTQNSLCDWITNRFRYNTNILYTNADGLEAFLDDINPKALQWRYNIGYWAWELPEFPDAWAPAYRQLQEIWTLSEFAATAIQAASPVPVFALPPAVWQPQPPAGFNRLYYNLPEDAFLFLFMYDVRSGSERKNPQAAIKAFAEAFAPSDNVQLVIKINAPEGWLQQNEWLRDVAAQQNIQVLDRFMSRDEINGLLHCTDAYISLHRSEGFGFGPAEAMFFGKPAVLTNWSGNTEYMREGACCPVDYRLVELERDYGPYKKGMHWAQPDLQSAIEYMRRLVQDTSYYSAIASNGQRVIRQEFSYEALGMRARKRLESLSLL